MTVLTSDALADNLAVGISFEGLSFSVSGSDGVNALAAVNHDAIFKHPSGDWLGSASSGRITPTSDFELTADTGYDTTSERFTYTDETQDFSGVVMAFDQKGMMLSETAAGSKRVREWIVESLAGVYLDALKPEVVIRNVEIISTP